MSGTNVTIKDIARKLGVSPSTVSRALKDHPEISPKTKKVVTELANLLGYKPNEIALSLRSKRTKVIGLIIPEIVHHFFSSVISGIEEIAIEEGYNVMIFQSNESYTREVLNTQSLYANRVDGLLVSLAKETKNYEHFRNLQKHEVPIVFFDRILEGLKTDRVIVDDYGGAFEAVEHLILSGYKKILHLSGSRDLLIGRNRINGYKDALEDNGLEVDENLVVPCDNYESAMQITGDIIDRHPGIDAIFAVNDFTAIGAMKAVKQKGKKVPDDIAIMGFTNNISSTLTDPTLSSVDQHGTEVGKEATRLLLKRLKEGDLTEDHTPQTRVVRTDLVVRESTARGQ
ncbi:MAG: LacI family transcriptional regulator [Bacteroidales bacterium]|nr:LacI family transcriptional regulator [Bacteroidales bacterium]MCF8337359.1 LacI family transcriptional regulator [Bacteroidales bacterium]